MMRKLLVPAALAAVCLMAAAPDADACGRRGRASGGSCGTTGYQAQYPSSFGQPGCAPCALPGAVLGATPAAPPALPGAAPQFVPDATKAPPAGTAIPQTLAAPADLVPAFAADPKTGTLRQIGWLRGSQFLPLQP